jgi:hypothetical protein
MQPYTESALLLSTWSHRIITTYLPAGWQHSTGEDLQPAPRCVYFCAGSRHPSEWSSTSHCVYRSSLNATWFRDSAIRSTGAVREGWKEPAILLLSPSPEVFEELKCVEMRKYIKHLYQKKKYIYIFLYTECSRAGVGNLRLASHMRLLDVKLRLFSSIRKYYFYLRLDIFVRASVLLHEYN